MSSNASTFKPAMNVAASWTPGGGANVAAKPFTPNTSAPAFKPTAPSPSSMNTTAGTFNPVAAPFKPPGAATAFVPTSSYTPPQ